MNHKLLLITAFALSAGAASAETRKPKKPVVCVNFEVIRGKTRVVALCLDSKPQVLVRFIVHEIPVAENDTDVRKVAIGYTSVD